jgi:hypothetical protein
MRSETTQLKMKLQESINATKTWMQKAQSLEAEIGRLKAQLNQQKSSNNAAG